MQKYHIKNLVFYKPIYNIANIFNHIVVFRFVQKRSLDCALTIIVKTISNLNDPKTTKEQLNVE